MTESDGQEPRSCPQMGWEIGSTGSRSGGVVRWTSASSRPARSGRRGRHAAPAPGARPRDAGALRRPCHPPPVRARPAAPVHPRGRRGCVPRHRAGPHRHRSRQDAALRLGARRGRRRAGPRRPGGRTRGAADRTAPWRGEPAGPRRPEAGGRSLRVRRGVAQQGALHQGRVAHAEAAVRGVGTRRPARPCGLRVGSALGARGVRRSREVRPAGPPGGVASGRRALLVR